MKLRKTILVVILSLSLNIHVQSQTNNLSDIKVDMLTYYNAASTIEKLMRDYNLKIVFDALRIKEYTIECEFNQEPVLNAINSICNKTKSKYYISDDGIIHIIAQNEKIPLTKMVSTPQNQYKGKPEKYNITISGIITDQQTGEGIPFATIQIRDKGIGATSNANGFFTINKVPSDTCCLITSYMGYQSNYFFLSPTSSYQNLRIELRSSSTELNAITIIGEKDEIMQQKKDEISIIRMSPKKLEQLPNLGEKDIMRSFQLMPGISGSNESSSNLYVRGGTPDQNLVLYDGFTVYQVDHLYGFYSAFNANAVKDVQLYKGGFESKYGGRLSSVTEITGKDGNQKRFNCGGDLSLLSANVFVEAPIGKKVTFIGTARRSYQGLLYDKIFGSFQTTDNSKNTTTSMPGGMSNESTVKSYFYDINSKLTFRPTEKDILSLSFFNGNDKLDNGVEFDASGMMANMNVNFNITDLTSYGNTGTSLKWGRKWGPKLYSNTLITFSNYYSKRDRTTDGSIVDESGADKSIKQGIIEKNNLIDQSFKSDFDWSIAQNHKIGFGIFSTYYDISYKYSQNDTSTIIDKQNYGLLSGVYIQDKINFFKSKLNITPGVRISFFDITNKVYYEPRLASTFNITKKFTAKAAIGRFYQFANRVTREDILSGSRDFWILSNNSNIPVSSSLHYIGGLSYETKKYLFSAEAYYKDISNISEYSLRFDMGNPQQGGLTYNENFFNGTGTAKGIEFLIQKKSGKLNGWVSYTLGQVQNHFDIYSNQDYAANQDVTHEFKSVLTYKLKRFDFSVTWIYATGKPYTAPSGAYNVTLLDGTTQDYFTTTSKNSLRLPDYHRLDLAVNYNLRNLSGNDIGYIGFSLFNVYNRTNVWYKQYQIVSGQIIETNVNYLGITPNLTLSLKLH